MRGKFCSGTKVLKTIISTAIDVKARVRTAPTIKLKTSRVKSQVVIRRFVGEIAQYWERKNCQSTNCESQSNECRPNKVFFGTIGDGDVFSSKTNNNNSKDSSENWGRE
jgi:hypothetical protein